MRLVATPLLQLTDTQIKTPKLYYRSQLNRDGSNRASKIPIVFDVIDFTPYNPIYIVGETSGRYVVGPVRSWMEQNKPTLVAAHKDVVYCVFGRKTHRSVESMKAILGEPLRTLIIDSFEYPLDMQTYIDGDHVAVPAKLPLRQRMKRFIHS